MASEDPYLRAPVVPGHENYVALVVTADASDVAIGAVLSQKAWSGGMIETGALMDHPCGSCQNNYLCRSGTIARLTANY